MRRHPTASRASILNVAENQFQLARILKSIPLHSLPPISTAQNEKTKANEKKSRMSLPPEQTLCFVHRGRNRSPSPATSICTDFRSSDLVAAHLECRDAYYLLRMSCIGYPTANHKISSWHFPDLVTTDSACTQKRRSVTPKARAKLTQGLTNQGYLPTQLVSCNPTRRRRHSSHKNDDLGHLGVQSIRSGRADRACTLFSFLHPQATAK